MDREYKLSMTAAPALALTGLTLWAWLVGGPPQDASDTVACVLLHITALAFAIAWAKIKWSK